MIGELLSAVIEGPAIVSVRVAHAQLVGGGSNQPEYTFIVTRSSRTNDRLEVPFTPSLPEGAVIEGLENHILTFEPGASEKMIVVRGGKEAVTPLGVDVAITLDTSPDGAYALKDHENQATARAIGKWTSGRGEIEKIVHETSFSASLIESTVSGSEDNDTMNIIASSEAKDATFAAARLVDSAIYGGHGDDEINILALPGSSSSNSQSDIYNIHVYGGDGDDMINVSAVGGVGSTNVGGNISSSNVFGGNGSDTIILSARAGEGGTFGPANVVYNKVYGGDGHDTITLVAQASENAILRSAQIANNEIYGGDGDDAIILKNLSSYGGIHIYSNMIHGGEGKDTFAIIGSGRGSGTNESDVNTIADFNAGEADLILMPEKGNASNFRVAEQDMSTYLHAHNEARYVMKDNTVKYFFAAVGEDGYLFYDLDGVAGVDNVIKLTGVTTLEFSSIDAFVG